jgi:hypothetical protein
MQLTGSVRHGGCYRPADLPAAAAPHSAVAELGVVRRMRAFTYNFVVTATMVFLAGCGVDYKKRYDKPLSYAQAIREKDIAFPLPPSSHNINYAMYADWQAYQRLVRFEAPMEDCIRHIDVVLAWHAKMHKWTSSYPRVEVTSVEQHGGDTEMGATPWFDVDKIRHGIYTGKNSSHTPEIWVDTDRGVFYYCETD